MMATKTRSPPRMTIPSSSAWTMTNLDKTSLLSLSTDALSRATDSLTYITGKKKGADSTSLNNTPDCLNLDIDLQSFAALD